MIPVCYEQTSSKGIAQKDNIAPFAQNPFRAKQRKQTQSRRKHKDTSKADSLPGLNQ